MGMQLRNCVIRDDVAPYQRYDLEDLLLGWDLLSPSGSGSGDSGSSTGTSSGKNRKWIIPVVVVGVVALIAAALLLIVYVRRWVEGDNPTAFINVHMLKMMENNTLQPYAAVKMDSLARWDNRNGGGGGGGGDSGLRLAAVADTRSVGSGRLVPRFGTVSQARSARFGEASSGHGTARISAEEGGDSDAGLVRPMGLTGPMGPTGPGAPFESPRGTSPIADGQRRGGGGGGGLVCAVATASVPECAVIEPADAADMHDGHGGRMMAPWGTGYAWPAASNFVYRGYDIIQAVPYQGNIGYGYSAGWTTGAAAPLAMAAAETYETSRGMPATPYTHIAEGGAAEPADAEPRVLPQDAAAAVRQAAAAPLLHAPAGAVPVVRMTTVADPDGTSAGGGGGANAAVVPPPPLDVQGPEIQPLTTSPQHRSLHSRPDQRWCMIDTPADSFLDAVSGPTAVEGSSPPSTQHHQLIGSSDTTVIGDSRSASGGSGGGAAVAGPASLSPRLLSHPGSNSLQSTAATTATTAISGAGGSVISRQAAAPWLPRSPSVERAGAHSLVHLASAFQDAAISTAEAVVAASVVSSERTGTVPLATAVDEGGSKAAVNGGVTASRPAIGTATSEHGMKAPSQHHHHRLPRSSSAAGALMSVLRVDRRMWPWSPGPGANQQQQQMGSLSGDPAAVSPS
ncbi:hypothetical protein Vretifemale_14683, partial [Volvox reticuliferus]